MKVLFAGFFIFFVLYSYGVACNVCHSKNQKMVDMHKALDNKNCFTCHKLEKRKTLEELKNIRTEDARCKKCHSI
ncbi:MAG: cytochrome C [Proteobacteria bacterium]|nr:cytochrome C [Pseudomonadota bacterium]